METEEDDVRVSSSQLEFMHTLALVSNSPKHSEIRLLRHEIRASENLMDFSRRIALMHFLFDTISLECRFSDAAMHASLVVLRRYSLF